MKKFIVGILATLMLCGCVVGTSIAWLTDKTEPLENTFTSGNIQITLDRGNAAVDTLDFKMVPGKPITCPAYVNVLADSEKCYLYVMVIKPNSFDNYMTYAIADGWTQLEDNNGDDIAGVYYREVATSVTDQPFNILKDNTLTVKTDVTSDMLTAVSADANKLQLNYIAFAVQYDYIAAEDATNRAYIGWTTLGDAFTNPNP